MDKESKLKAREELLKKLNKDHGKGTIGVYGTMEKIDVETISSGSFGLDAALGVGGWARGLTLTPHLFVASSRIAPSRLLIVSRDTSVSSRSSSPMTLRSVVCVSFSMALGRFVISYTLRAASIIWKYTRALI